MMLKTLLKKQFLESIAFLFYNKEGKRRSMGSMLGFAVLLLLGLVSFCFLFYELSVFTCAALVSQGLTWVYFALIGTMATALGVVGSVFAAKTKLYEAKDNDLLFSMPIPSWLVLFSRAAGLYLFTLAFEALIFVPAIVAYLVEIGFSAVVLLYGMLTLLVMPFGALAVCMILGWLLALLAAKLPAKNVMTVLATIAFLAVYFVLYYKMNDLLTYVLTNGGEVAGAMQVWLFPFWKMGLGCEGDIVGFLLYTLVFLGLFAVVYGIVSKTYLHLATANRGGKKAAYKSKEGKQGSWASALLKKECMRFMKNPMVAMNCCLGTLFFLVLPFILLFSTEFREMIALVSEDETFALILAALLASLCSMNTMAVSSVSLEGENLWILRSLPISTEKILAVKGAFHFFMTGLPALFAAVFMSILLKIQAGFVIWTAIFSVIFAAFSAILGLVINLKMPNLHWTNEVVAVKQSVAVIVAMLAEWAVVGLLVGGYFLFGKYLFAGGYFLVCTLFIVLVSALLVVWLSMRGKKIFEEL